jgi:hypothetical protein
VFAGETRRCRSRSADISADAEISASGVAGEAELFHSRLEPRPFHAEAGRGAGGPPITPWASRSAPRNRRVVDLLVPGVGGGLQTAQYQQHAKCYLK